MLALHEVSKTFGAGGHVLSRVTLGVEPGTILAIVGGSGCGKTTLLRAIAGLERPSTGEIWLDGLPVHEPREDIGLVFQEPRLLPWLTVRQNIGFGLEAVEAGERDALVDRALDRIGLFELGDAYPRRLSGGQAQRVALARALVLRPKALLLDEPFSALDAITRADLQDHLLALWQDYRPTLVLVTHDVAEAAYLADEVAVMAPRPGRIVETIRLDIGRPRDRLSKDIAEAGRRLGAALARTFDDRPRLAAG